MKTVFNYNTPVTAEWFNVVNGFRLRFDGDPLLPGDMVDGQYLPIRLQDLDPAILSPYAQSLYVVKTTGNQNINGDKTFLDPVTIVPGVNDNHAITKAQLDAAITALNTAITNANNARLALDAATVKLTTAQTIAGVKTFNNSPIVPPGSIPGAAVNLSQLKGAIDYNNGANWFVLGSLKFLFGVANKSSQYGGSTTWAAIDPTFPGFTTPPIVTIGGVGNYISMFGILSVNNLGFAWHSRDLDNNPGILSTYFMAVGV